MTTTSTAIDLKEIVIKGWSILEPEAICKDAATKGTNIPLCHSYLAKRLNFSPDDARTYFRKEVTKYVNRLLSDRQVFKAEHVLLNVNRLPKFLFYEYAKTGTENEAVRDAIFAHLRKSDANFDLVTAPQMEIDLKLLHYCQTDPVLHAKYKNILIDFQLETMHRATVHSKFRPKLAAEIFFQVNPNREVATILDKHVTWQYLLEQKSFAFVRDWLHVRHRVDRDAGQFPQPNATNSFRICLENLFADWPVDDEMQPLAEQNYALLDDVILNGLARCGIILSAEQMDVPKCLRRIFTTESWTLNQSVIGTESFRRRLVAEIMNRGLIGMLVEDFIDCEALQTMAKSLGSRPDLDLCVAVKCADLSTAVDFAMISDKVAQFLIGSKPTFYQDAPLVYLFDMLSANHCVADVLASEHHRKHLANIPFTRALLTKLTTIPTSNDYRTSTDEMVRKFCKIDLQVIRAEAGDGDETGLNFAHPTLIEKYARPAKLDYVHYVRQRRSAYAVYTFIVDQLQAFSQLSPRQIIVACVEVAEIAVEQFVDHELVAHCMAFIEMLGMDSSSIRAYIKCMHFVRTHNPIVDVHRFSDSELMRAAERALLDAWVQGGKFNVRQFEAIAQVYRARGWALGVGLLEQISTLNGGGNWYQLMLVATYFRYPVEHVVEVCERLFCGALGQNLARAIRYEVAATSGHRSGSVSYRERRKVVTNRSDVNSVTSGETMSSSVSSNETVSSSKVDPTKYLSPTILSAPLDLFAIILQCICSEDLASDAAAPLSTMKFLDLLRGNDNELPNSTHLNLLRKAIELKWPLLAILSAMIRTECRQHCWIVWLMMSTDLDYIPVDDLSVHRPTEQQLVRCLIDHCVANRFTRTLDSSIRIFFGDNSFAKFTEYLARTQRYDFSPEVTDLLKVHLMHLSRNAGDDPNGNATDDAAEFLNIDKADLLSMCVYLLIRHVNTGFSSVEHQIQLLQTVCDSGVADFVLDTIDLAAAKCLLEVCRFTSVRIDLERLARDRQTDSEIRLEYERICEQLIGEKEFDKAMDVADLLAFPKDSMVYESWVYGYETDAVWFDLQKCEREIEEHALGPELVIGFYLYVADRLSYANVKKYRVLKRTLDVIKRHHLFPNESFDRDRIEYEMVLSALKNGQPIDEVDVYHSEYFETIMVRERKVLYKSFMELKEMASIDDLTVVNKRLLDQSETDRLDALICRLLDEGDIVQALRIQAMFNYRPIDLHYLVFCMALAEGLATLYDLTYEQRQILSDDIKTAVSRFDRRTLNTNRHSQTSTPSSPKTSISAGGAAQPNDSFDTSDNFEFEEIPSREKQNVLEALQCLAAKVTHGTKIGQRIAMVCRAALYLDKEYVDVLKTKDALVLLQNAIDEDCLNKLVVMNDIMQSMQMTDLEIANFLAQQIATSIVKSRFYLLQNQGNPMSISQTSLWGYDLDTEFRMFLELSPNTSLLGTNLLKYCDALKLYRKFDANRSAAAASAQMDRGESSAEIRELYERLRDIMESKMLSHKKQNTISVELLVKAHDCFLHECYMEGIALVLQRAKHLNTVLASAKSWSLIVKMLIGIGRYRDMYYCFETLIANDQFESLLGQFDEDRVNGLKQAIISYLHEHCPDNKDHYRLAALHFMMYKELAEMWESEANATVARIIAESGATAAAMVNNGNEDVDTIQHLCCGPQVGQQLQAAMEGYAHAAENYLLENKLGLAQRTAQQAELIALQINLHNRAMENNNDGQRCVCVLSIRTVSVMRTIVNNELSVPQSQILSRVYPFEINWTDAIFNQYVLNGNEDYLNDFCERIQLTECMIETIVKTFQHQSNYSKAMEQNISTLIEMVDSVSLRYKLASVLGLKKIIATLINDQCSYYLKDTNYGRTDS